MDLPRQKTNAPGNGKRNDFDGFSRSLSHTITDHLTNTSLQKLQYNAVLTLIKKKTTLKENGQKGEKKNDTCLFVFLGVCHTKRTIVLGSSNFQEEENVGGGRRGEWKTDERGRQDDGSTHTRTLGVSRYLFCRFFQF